MQFNVGFLHFKQSCFVSFAHALGIGLQTTMLLRYDTIGKIELIHFSILSTSTRDPNCKNDIQSFLQQFEKSGVNGDTN